jgi:hypothetical protein
MRPESVRASPDCHKTTVCLSRKEQGAPKGVLNILVGRVIVLVGLRVGVLILSGWEDSTI